MQCPSSYLRENHNYVGFHITRGAVSYEYVKTAYVFSKENPSNIITKALGPMDVYNLTGPIIYNQLYQEGDTL